VIDTKRSSDGRGASYLMRFRGGEHTVLTERGSTKWPRYDFFPPKQRGSVRLAQQKLPLSADEVREILSAQQAQRARGDLKKVSEFNRELSLSEALAFREQALARTNKACDAQLTYVFDDAPYSDELVQRRGFTSACDAPLEALQSLCETTPEVKPLLKAHLKEVSCDLQAPMSLSVEGGRLSWVLNWVADEAYTEAQVYEALNAISLGGARLGLLRATSKIIACQAPDGGVLLSGSLRSSISDGHGPSPSDQVAYLRDGDALQLLNIDSSPKRFFNPRAQDPKRQRTEGYEQRYFAHLTVDGPKGSCALSCGDKTLQLKRLSFDERLPLLGALKRLSPSHISASLSCISRRQKGNVFI